MLVIQKPTPKEMEHIWQLAAGGVAEVASIQPFAEVAPVEGDDGQWWAKHELHGEPYATIHFQED